MTILVCPLSKVAELVAMHAPSRVVSVLDPALESPALGRTFSGRHLRLSFHDIHVPSRGTVLPTAAHVEALTDFLDDWDRAGTMLVHCRAGIGRSTATAFIAACFYNAHVDERTIAERLRSASPLARPNHVLTALADDALGRRGRMLAAIVETGHGLGFAPVDESTPFELPSRF
jgi:predicted protein tyrosine phosphatase